VARTARERTGGQGFLLINKLGDGLVSAHSGMTAEGDNRVLMQKIVKDLLSDTQKGVHVPPKMTMCPERQMPTLDSVSDLEALKNLIFYREVWESQRMQDVLADLIMTQGKPFFEVWLKEVSNNI